LPEKRTSERPNLLRARLRATAPRSGIAGESITVRVDVKNIGDTTWLAQAKPGGRFVTLGVDWLDPANQPCEGLGSRVHLARDLPPGQSVRLSFETRLPTEPGPCRLRLDMVNELYAWFGDLGSQRLVLELIARQPSMQSIGAAAQGR
jgi:hypothetical protein